MSADYSCAICLDSASDPVVTRCGHLYCWPCLDQWLSRQRECPTCKGAVNPEKPGDIIPLYGKGKSTSDGPASDKPRPEAPAAAASGDTATADGGAEPAGAAAAAAEGAPRPHAFDTRHERPRAQRQAPLGGNRTNSWWALGIVGTPTFLGDTGSFALVVVVCLASYFIYKYWQERGRNNARANNGPQQEGQPDQAAGNNNPPAGANNNNNAPSMMPAILAMAASVFLVVFFKFINDDDVY